MAANDDFAADINLKEAYDNLTSVLLPGETIIAWATQPRIFAIAHRRAIIAATSGRFIYIKRKLLGGFDMFDFRWQDIAEVTIKVGMFGAGVFFKVNDSDDMNTIISRFRIFRMDGFDKEKTQEIYRFAQAQDQSWREKRRIRDLEELRAKSGGINIGMPGTTPSGTTHEDPTLKLQQAKQMLDNNLITDSEYESIKAKIINQI